MKFTETIKECPVDKCAHAYPGTYGHECGKPATLVAIKKLTTDRDWLGGVFFSGRCEECARADTPENKEITLTPLNGHVNRLRTRMFSSENNRIQR